MSESGFTLLEVLAAVAILCFGLLIVASMQVTAIQKNYLASRITEASAWGQEELEALLALPYTDGALSAGTTTEQKGDYTITRVITDDDPATNVKHIVVTVTWPECRMQNPPRFEAIKTRL